MNNVWKVGSRWDEYGNRNKSILDIFRRNRVVFVGADRDAFRQIREGDLIAVSDGRTVAAMGVATSAPRPITDLGVLFTEDERGRFDYDESVWGCRLSFEDLPEDQQPWYRSGAFHRVIDRAEEFREIYARHRNRFQTEQQFEIKARSCTLFRNAQSGDDILWKQGLRFEVPIYQRRYSWGGDQVRKLLSDLLGTFHGRNGGAPNEPIFIGTIQLTARAAVEREAGVYKHEVIDGQQRLSTMIMLLKVLRDLHPEIEVLRGLNLEEKLHTRVSSGQQQAFLTEALRNTANDEISAGQNPYLLNALLIAQILREAEIPEEGGIEAFDPVGFAEYVLSRVYFVVIETRAGLSKTLQIFDAINTAGMDLNGGDIFKVRFYEYLRKKGAAETVFEEISGLYEAVDRRNTAFPWKVTWIEEILSLAQHVLIPRHGLGRGLHGFAGATFFERLFDVFLSVNVWEGFSKERVQSVDVTINELAALIEARFDWQLFIASAGAEVQCAFRLIEWSRYPRYTYLAVLFRFRFGAETQLTESFVVQLSKLLLLYSVWKRRAINEAHSLVHDLLERMFNPASDVTAEQIIHLLHERTVARLGDLNWVLDNEALADNATAKGLVCRLSAMLHEMEAGQWIGNDLIERLFESATDIEHIESVNHQDEALREAVWNEWQGELDRIGNLMLLERFTNRSIGNGDYQGTKLPAYAQSSFAVARRQAVEYPMWNLRLCRQRKANEINSIIGYLSSIGATAVSK